MGRHVHTGALAGPAFTGVMGRRRRFESDAGRGEVGRGLGSRDRPHQRGERAMAGVGVDAVRGTTFHLSPDRHTPHPPRVPAGVPRADRRAPPGRSLHLRARSRARADRADRPIVDREAGRKEARDPRAARPHPCARRVEGVAGLPRLARAQAGQRRGRRGPRAHRRRPPRGGDRRAERGPPHHALASGSTGSSRSRTPAGSGRPCCAGVGTAKGLGLGLLSVAPAP